MQNTSLLSLKEGESAEITEIKTELELKNRLFDLGLVFGSRTSFLFSSPTGDPRAFLVRGAVIALRKRDCAQIEIIKGEAE